jgi:hypothetical protein
VVKRQER